MIDWLQILLGNLWQIWLESAPWLLVGLLAAGMVQALVPAQVMLRWLGGRGMAPILKAAIIGTPLPLCSCGVLPAAIALRRRGASRGATVSFLIATPENGADSIALSYALLGPFMAVIRPVAAILSAVLAGVLAEWGGGDSPDRAGQASPSAGHCCGDGRCGTSEQSETAAPLVRGGNDTALAVSGGTRAAPEAKAALRPPQSKWPARLLAGMRFAILEVFGDILGWLMVGIALAAVMITVLPPDALAAWGHGLPAMLLMLLIGLPMYICASASTPVAAALLLAGVSPGAVLVFLLAGPATNFAGMMVLRKELGTRTVALYLLGISVGAVGMGLLTDALVAWGQVTVQVRVGDSAELLPAWLSLTAAILLLALALALLARNLASRFNMPVPHTAP